MTDIVERLREGKFVGGKWVMQEAADEIERLRIQKINMAIETRKDIAKIQRLQEALRKILNMGQSQEPDHWQARCKMREIAENALKESE